MYKAFLLNEAYKEPFFFIIFSLLKQITNATDFQDSLYIILSANDKY